MKKFYFKVSAALLICASATTAIQAEVAQGDKFNVGDYYYQVLSPGRQTVSLIKPTTYAGKYAMTDADVPATVSYEGIDFRVVSVAKSAFASATCVSIKLPSSVKAIYDGAFDRCQKLTSITLPSALDSLGASAFYDCRVLTSVALPASLRFIGDKCFTGAPAITEFAVGAGSKYFSARDGMLFNAAGDTLLYYGEGHTATSVTIPEGVEVVGPYCFNKNKTITEVTFPANVRATMTSAFDGCTNLATINFSEGLRELGPSTFQQAAIATLALPESLEIIGGNAFMLTKNLTNIVIPDRVDSIGTYAFYNNTSATDVTIGRNVRKMAQQVFGRDNNIVNVVSLNPEPPECANAQFTTSKGVLKVPASAVDAYKASVGFSNLKSIEALPMAETMTLGKTELQMNPGESEVIAINVTPADAYAYAKWTSSDETVATVDNLGRVTAKANGQTTIKAESIDGAGLSAECAVSVGPGVGIDSIEAPAEGDAHWYNLQGIEVNPSLCRGQVLIHAGKKVVVK